MAVGLWSGVFWCVPVQAKQRKQASAEQMQDRRREFRRLASKDTLLGGKEGRRGRGRKVRYLCLLALEGEVLGPRRLLSLTEK